MGTFVVTDPRGFQVVVYETTLRHAADGHRGEFGGKLTHHLLETVRAPDVVVANPKSFRAPDRTGGEVFVRFDATLSAFVLVPARIENEALTVAGFGTTTVGARVALSAYVKTSEPLERVLWRK